jgi:hypothetical protein
MKILRSVARAACVAALLLAAAHLAFYVIVTQPWVPAGRDALPFRADPERLRRHVEVLANEVGPRDAAHPESLAIAADYLAAELAKTGAAVEHQDFTVRGASYRNVLARVGPADGPLLVVGAHYDAMGEFGPNPGADDNASGAAGLVELAGLLAARSPRARVELVAYANEEPPYFASRNMGSAVHAERLLREGRRPEAMICFEMIGFFSEKQPWPARLLALLYPAQGDFVMLAGRWADRHLAAKVKAGFRARNDLPAETWAGPFIAGMDASDHRNYWQAGIPALMVTDTAILRNPHYHTAGDLPGTLDYPKMAYVVEGVANFLHAF